MYIDFLTPIRAKSISGTTICGTCLIGSTPRFTGINAKTTETCVAYFKSDGTLVSGTSTGGGISWSGTTANGIATYYSATQACSNANMTFDGTSLDLAGNLVFRTGAIRSVCIAGTTSTIYALCLVGQDSTVANATTVGGAVLIKSGKGGCNSGGAGGAGGLMTICGGLGGNGTAGGNGGIGGGVSICAGTGGASASTQGPAGGVATICGGAGGASSTTGPGGAGGTVIICGGIGATATSTGGAGGAGGNLCLCGGAGVTGGDGIAGSGGAGGCVVIHAGVGANATTTGGNGGTVFICAGAGGTPSGTVGTICMVGATCVTGALTISTTACATTCMCSPVVCSTGKLDAGTCILSGTQIVAGSYLCSTTYTDIGTCAVLGTNLSLDAAAAHIINYVGCNTTGTGCQLSIVGQTGRACASATACPGGIVCVIAGTGGQNTVTGVGGAGGATYICGGGGGAGATAGGAGGALYLVGGTITGNATAGVVYICGGGSAGGGATGGAVCIVGGCAATNGDVLIYNGTCLAIKAIHSSCVELYYNNTVKLCTVTNGICLGTNCGFATDWVGTSDCRLKRDILPISNALSMITHLQGVCYYGCDDEKCELRIGLIAQDVEKIIPEIVSRSTPSKVDMKYGIEDEKLGLKYDKLTAVLVEAIKEQQLQIICLQQEIKELKNK